MDNPEYEKFLLDIADDVAKLVAISENRTCFEHHSCDLGKKQAAYSEARKRGANQMPPEPLAGFLSVLTHDKDIPDVVPRPKIDEALAYYYFSLATIHDKMRDEGYIPIHNNSEAKQLAKSVWATIEKLCVDRQFIIKIALDYVEADLARKKPAETEPDTARAKCWRIIKKIPGWLFKKTWHLVVIIIGGLIVAILIDIFGDFGWLERIKDFIYEILHICRDNIQ
ncbi:MAG: hypothetical protein H8D56_15910 [Planctomycetes bacterium]|nr:hypothetical protein [Planctomycetota bacterium]MBL7146599.1 hypothetical protein [Phycisphaerae bacterium]